MQIDFMERIQEFANGKTVNNCTLLEKSTTAKSVIEWAMESKQSTFQET
jgi:hypothetical protein